MPAAGLGTRFLPATKTVPKELLPVVDTPGIELVVAEEAKSAGAHRLLIITSPGKDGVVAHFVEDLVLENTLAKRGKAAMLAKVRKAPTCSRSRRSSRRSRWASATRSVRGGLPRRRRGRRGGALARRPRAARRRARDDGPGA